MPNKNNIQYKKKPMGETRILHTSNKKLAKGARQQEEDEKKKKRHILYILLVST
jgi:hypothetical protein